MKILAIETSCDETAVAVVERQPDGFVKIISETVASSLSQHVQTGGIVPEVAARAQMEVMIPTLRKTFNDVEMECGKPVEKCVDGLAVTVGPGLVGSLLVGIETTKTLAWVWGKPVIGVNHLKGHLYANWLVSDNGVGENNRRELPEFPALGLIVSGGHTDLVMIRSQNQIERIGGTRDDAVGECLDKCGRILGLPYPGGVTIAQISKDLEKNGYKPRKLLPKPLVGEDNLEMSFSGLKVAVTNQVKKDGEDKLARAEIAYELIDAVTTVLIKKLTRSVKSYRPKTILLAGGVAANWMLRQKLEQLSAEVGLKIHMPMLKYCTDNAAMIGAAACYQQDKLKLEANPGLSI